MTVSILQLRIELLHVKPLIWRRLQVPSNCTFWDLHIAIQSAFGWMDSHLHEFRREEARDVSVRYSIPIDAFDDVPILPSWEHRIVEALGAGSTTLYYEYDFGDGWLHRITFEEVLPPAAGKKYPRCTAGERNAPPDDCGGPSGYAELLKVLANPDDPEHGDSHVWASSQKGGRGKFDPEAFDEQRVKFANPRRRLKQLLG